VAYEEAQRIDHEGPETPTRIGAVLCMANPGDRKADEAFGRALEEDPTFSGLWVAKARCALRRGDEAAAQSDARRATELNPSADRAISRRLFHRVLGPMPPGDIDALLALTVTERDPAAAWNALVSWAEARGEIALWARALVERVRMAPATRDATAHAAEALAGLGELADARSVAAAAADSDAAPLACGSCALAPRLAVDEAIARHDASLVRKRATRVRVSIEEAAARALLMGQTSIARDLATLETAADPLATGASLVLEASDPHDWPRESKGGHRGEVVSASAWLAFGLALSRADPPQKARAALGALRHESIVAGDESSARAAVELASLGVIGIEVLPPDARVELQALRGGQSPHEGPSAADAGALDARHEYLALALAEPRSERTRQLGEQFARLRSADRVVAVASGIASLGAGLPIDRSAPAALLALSPFDPLVAATALRMAEKLGDTDVERRARAALTSLADRPATAQGTSLTE
jgi:tetratricopeptide (TPR) repeat protein